MEKRQLRILYREFLFRIVDWELLSKHAQGDSRALLAQFASLLIFCSLILTLLAWAWAANVKNDRMPALMQLMSSWTMEHFLIATSMLMVGLVAVVSWESTFPDRRDVLVLGPLPIRARTLFFAKVAAVATALGLTLAALHALAGVAWPLALAQSGSLPAPALVFDPPLPPVSAKDFPSVMNRDIEPMLRRLDLAAADGGAGIVIGISERGTRRIMAYGAAKPDSLFEIGSITKTFTGLLLAQMAVQGKLDLGDPVRVFLPHGSVAMPSGPEITLLDLATHHSGLPRMPDNAGSPYERETYTDYRLDQLFDFVKRHGVGKPMNPDYLYSNIGFAVLGAALTERAGMSYQTLLKSDITDPLGMRDTVITLSPARLRRLMQGHDGARQPTARWDLDAFASAGGIRSSAGDMLKYLEAQLHPERTPFRAALKLSQRLRNYVGGNVRIGLAWQYDSDRQVYEHGGGTGGFTSFALFDPDRDFAAVGLMNAVPVSFPFLDVLAERVRQRLRGEPALSLAPVTVAPAGRLRSLFAYWISMLAAGVFTFCCILGLEGLAAQLLPRRIFLRVSGVLQLTIFSALICGYFLQRSPLTVLITGARQPWLAWIPSYWFAGVYQQLSGALHPALAPFAHRAWLGLAAAICATAAAYALSYRRSLGKIVEEPEISPGTPCYWMPRFGNAFETAVVQFSIRTLLRSRQHRVIFSFYVGVALAFAILFLNAPPEVAGPSAGRPWDLRSVPLLASSIALVGLWIVGVRVVFSLPLQLPANWIFQIAPIAAGAACLRARRRALLVIAVTPPLALCAAVLFSVWPWRTAGAHIVLLVFFGVILSEFSVDGVQRIPFACSYLPGRSKLHLTFWLWIYLLTALVIGAANAEREALKSTARTFILLSVLGLSAAICVLRNNWLARDSSVELRFEEIPSDQLLTLDLG